MACCETRVSWSGSCESTDSRSIDRPSGG